MEPLLFDLSSEPLPVRAGRRPEASRPLAARLRPKTFDDYIGQRHVLAPGKLLRRAIDGDTFSSIILSGPPGVGKTSLAELVATVTSAEFVRLSGVASNVADLRKEIAAAKDRRRANGRHTIVFIDEIHRFSRSQQDALLPDIESGNIRFIGATTQNPYFFVISPLISRSLVFRLEPLGPEDIKALLGKALRSPDGFGGRKVELDPAAADFWAGVCEGDARRALNALEIAVLTTDPGPDGVARVDLAVAEASIQAKAMDYGDDGHYDTSSAFIKSMRGSDPDAALYWLAKMLKAGDDPMFIARRIVIFASEDVGNADPKALELSVAAMQAAEMIGLPEARLILAQAVTYCATAPKSNASCVAISEAMADIENDRIQPVPVHLRDSHYQGAKDMGHGADYKYPHDYEGGFVAQDYLGVSKRYYRPAQLGYERKIGERLEFWRQLRNGSTPPATEK